jgi:hypothetical protein
VKATVKSGFKYVTLQEIVLSTGLVKGRSAKTMPKQHAETKKTEARGHIRLIHEKASSAPRPQFPLGGLLQSAQNSDLVPVPPPASV